MPWWKFWQRSGAAQRTTTIEMVRIPAGTFRMGSDEGYCDEEKPAHEVHITKPFLLGKYPVTQAQYEAVIGENPSYFKGPKRPVENVTWGDAVKFCRKLTEMERGAGRLEKGEAYRLPSEAEWEYAYRAGTTTQFYWGDTKYHIPDIDKTKYNAWSFFNAQNQTHPVGKKKPNAWGLYDMAGNVWEFCADVWHENYEGAPTDGSAWVTTGGPRVGSLGSPVLRGGSWNDPEYGCRAAFRSNYTPDDRNGINGFRVVLASD